MNIPKPRSPRPFACYLVRYSHRDAYLSHSPHYIRSVIKPPYIEALLPAVMNQRANVAIVDLAYTVHLFMTERGERCRTHVVLHLLRVLGAGDGACRLWNHQDPAQAELRHCRDSWH